MGKISSALLASVGFWTCFAAGSSTAAAMSSGKYEGTADGGWMTIMVRGKAVEVVVGSGGGCGGWGKGSIAKVDKNHWKITLKDNGQACTLDILKQGADRYNIEENGCSYFHGAACSFDGFVRERK